MKDKSMVYMSGTSMGSGIEMKCGSQVGKYMGGPKMMGGDEKYSKEQQKNEKSLQSNEIKTFNKKTWDRATHKGFTDFQYAVPENKKNDKSLFSGYNNGKTTAKLIALKTGGSDKEMTRGLEKIESAHLKNKVSKNFYQGAKDVFSKGDIKTKAHKDWEEKNNHNNFVSSR